MNKNKNININKDNKKDNKKVVGIYVHIPFCKSKCSYCDFLSFNLKNDLIKEEYIEALQKEIKNTILKLEKIYNIQNSKIKKELGLPIYVNTVYIGGGTPSLIESQQIKNILTSIKNEFILLDDAEITIEVNPESITEEKIKSYKDMGINRISIGLQTTNDSTLKQIGRLYTFSEFKEKYSLLKKYFTNINIDLIFGLPNQTMEDIHNDLKEILKLNPSHISTYSLILEKNSKLYTEITKYNLKLPTDVLNRDMYWFIKKHLEENNYVHYEISNFSQKGKESKHNLNCWEQKEYLAYGIGGSSYFHNIRFNNISNLPLYIDNVNNNIIDINIEEIQSITDMEKEYMFLNLRTLQGVNIEKFKNKFRKNPLILFEKEIKQLTKNGLLEYINDGNLNNIRLTKKGLDLANLVWEEFI